MKSSELRRKYLEFFMRHGHEIIPSAPLIPTDAEQLEGKEKVLFTSAGMQPLIPYLLGEKHPSGNKLVDSQKCLRTDDILEVGDNTHHTFFEMLGNWSLGSYWKKEAIEMSFNFLTQEIGVPIEKLFVTVFAGDDDAPRDEESANTWKELGIPENQISYLGKTDNWWPTSRIDPKTGEMKNAFGPCGPDTEMFYWTGEGSPEGRPETDDRWVEIWNDVFMQYYRNDDGTLSELSQKNVDTGMGLERTLAILNGKNNNYETDLFLPIIDQVIKKLEINDPKGEKIAKSLRVIADHIKASTFLIKAGVTPSNKLQGYVLRKLLRRAAVKVELIKENSMEALSDLVDIVLQIYKETDYFEAGDESWIREIIDQELDKFRRTLQKGLKEVDKITEVNGKVAFDLYQTYGFPFEILEELFSEKGKTISKEEFDEEFKKHQGLSKN